MPEDSAIGEIYNNVEKDSLEALIGMSESDL